MRYICFKMHNCLRMNHNVSGLVTASQQVLNKRLRVGVYRRTNTISCITRTITESSQTSNCMFGRKYFVPVKQCKNNLNTVSKRWIHNVFNAGNMTTEKTNISSSSIKKTWNCWGCHAKNSCFPSESNEFIDTESLSPNSFFCSACNLICPSDAIVINMNEASDIYKLFNLGPVRFDISLSLLESHYRQLQLRLHPDRFSMCNMAERAIADHYSSLISVCFSQIKNPLTRGVLVLRDLQKIRVVESNDCLVSDTTTVVERNVDDSDLLSEILDYEEAIETLTDMDTATTLHNELIQKFSDSLLKLYNAFARESLEEAHVLLQRCQMLKSVEMKVAHWKNSNNH